MSDNTKIMPESIADELDKILAEYMHTAYEQRQEALDAGAAVLETRLEQNAPHGATGGLARGFTIKYKSGGKGVKKYKNSRFIGNTKTVSGRGKDGRYREEIPLINLNEYGEHGKPFVRATFDASVGEIYDAIKQKLK